LSNEIDNSLGEKGARNVQVLLDDAAFSENTLKELFSLLIKRYPEPDWIYVWVVTSLHQVATPEEADLPQLSESNSNPDYDKYHHAVLIKQGEDEFFRYFPNPPSAQMKTVVIRGIDSATGLRAPPR
jgi:hypothetical protein